MRIIAIVGYLEEKEVCLRACMTLDLLNYYFVLVEVFPCAHVYTRVRVKVAIPHGSSLLSENNSNANV